MVKGCEGLVERAAIDQLMVPAWLPQIALVGGSVRARLCLHLTIVSYVLTLRHGQ